MKLSENQNRRQHEHDGDDDGDGDADRRAHLGALLAPPLLLVKVALAKRRVAHLTQRPLVAVEAVALASLARVVAALAWGGGVCGAANALGYGLRAVGEPPLARVQIDGFERDVARALGAEKAVVADEVGGDGRVGEEVGRAEGARGGAGAGVLVVGA
eukprot:1307625-Pleurochrysis_carterae.AAC.1